MRPSFNINEMGILNGKECDGGGSGGRGEGGVTASCLGKCLRKIYDEKTFHRQQKQQKTMKEIKKKK